MRSRTPRVPSHRECCSIVMLVASGLGPPGRSPHSPLSRTFRWLVRAGFPCPDRFRRPVPSGGGLGVSRQADQAFPVPPGGSVTAARPVVSGFPYAWPKPGLPSAVPTARSSLPDCAPPAASAVRVSRSAERFPRVFRHCCGHRCQHLKACVFPFPFNGFPLEVPVRSSLPTPASCASILSRTSGNRPTYPQAPH